MKKVLSFLMVFCLMLTVVPLSLLNIPVFAVTSDGFEYTSLKGETTITGVDESMISGDITIPATLGGYPVTIIGCDAFKGCENVTSVTVPNSVLYIGTDAFSYCDNLIEITLPNSLKSISNYAFYDCDNLESITIPDSVTSMGYAVFSYCDNLSDVTIGKGITSISDYTFRNCVNLETITIPANVTSIRDAVFYGCSNLKSVTLLAGIKIIGSQAFNNCSNLTDVYYEGSLLQRDQISFNNGNDLLTGAAWHYYISTVDESLYDYTVSNGEATITGIDISAGGDVLIPTSLEGSPVTSIENSVFRNRNDLTSITVSLCNTNYSSENGVLFNKDKTVLMCYPAGKSGHSYTLPSTVEAIDQEAFGNCSDLARVTIGAGVKNIGESAFANCISLNGITLPESVISIGADAFSDCGDLTDIWYTATAVERAQISIGDNNVYLNNALWHYDSSDVTAAYPESRHKAFDEVNKTWTYYHDDPTVAGIGITFSENTFVEYSYDFIYIYDLDNNFVGKYTGIGLKGNTVNVNDNGFKIKLVADQASNDFGFKVVDVEGFSSLSICDSNTATITKGGEIKYYTFTPKNSGKYVIYSNNIDNAEFSFEGLSKVNSSIITWVKENGKTFRLEKDLTADNTYIIGVKYNLESLTGTIPFTFGGVYTVSYDANGGSEAPTEQSKDFGIDITLSDQIPSREGYTFLGWSTSADASFATYQPGDVFVVENDTILYAVWRTNAPHLAQEGEEIYYYLDGVKQTEVTDLVWIDGVWYYIEEGRWASDIDTLHKINGKWFLVKGGIWNKTTGLEEYKGKTFYVSGGKWDASVTDLKKVDGVWYYIQYGKWNNTIDTLHKINGKWFLIKNGIWNKTTGLVEYKGKTFYVSGGKWNSSVNTLYKKGSKYYAIKSGKLYEGKTIITYSGKKFYCNKGYAQLSFSGKVKIGTKTYTIKAGKVV